MTLPIEVVALLAAFAYASSQVVSKLATRHGDVMSGLVVSLVAGAAALGVLCLATVDSWRIPASAVVLFVLAGVAGAGLGRLLMMRAVRDAGASVASPVLSSTQPVAATGFAVAFLGERPTAGRLSMLVLVVAGLWLSARGGSANRGIAVLHTGPVDLVRLLIWPVAAGAALATSDLLRKAALDIHPDAALGAFLGVATATLGWLLVTAVREPGALRRRPPAYGWFALHGVLTALAAFLLFLALRVGDLSLVAPIIAAQPVFVVMIGAVVLRNLEAVRTGTVVGALIVFGGIATSSLIDGTG
ncbi:DMT family transporter [Solwaraspora sp. WMMD406]|uniref:DMT family transporter n=1 Tax=Solwaraspora sp. WMMD406 TaxID=3016095 RepID=UPI002416183F|nr:DMT family transporter [Solwaraspora sp. WMMD406]MDG4763174.1 DMT family transporter [Solwaraspora sp. WMMD406]